MAGGHGHGALPTHTLHPGKRSASGGGARTWGAAAAAALIFIALLNAAYFARSGAAARAGAIGGAALSLLPEHPAGPLPRAAAGGGGVAGGAADDGGFATPDQEAASLAYLQEYVLKKPRLERPPVEGYWIEDFQAKNATVAEYRTKVRDYIASDAFKQGWDALKGQTGNERGIVISAGGEYYLPQAVVLLRQLRRHLNSTLPVEIYWHGDGEMDAGSLEALKAEFGPLEGYDASKLPYPSHHVPGVKIVGFPMKPYALLNSKFKHALLLDCDMQLLRDPAYLFDSPEYRAFGNLFWGDIYSEGMVRDEAYDYVGLNRAALASVNAGKGDFPRYAESGQVLIDRTRHLDVLEWVWFLNAFGPGHVYEFMYGDKDTYGIGFGLAGKAHQYQQNNFPPGGLFTHLDRLGWSPPKDQMKKQGNWWLHALVHYDPSGEALLFHRVTGEVRFGHKAPVDEVLTPPLPVSWSMWWMGYGPSNELQHTLEVMNFNLTALEASAPPGQACPLLLWAAYWTLRTHGIATDRRPELEAACDGALRAQYGAPAAALIRGAGLLERPLRLVVNKKWDEKIDGEWKQPRAPLLAVPLNMTAGYRAWLNLNESVAWANDWAPKNLPILGMKPAGRRRGLLLWRRPGRQLQAAAAPTGGGSGGGGGGVAAAA